MIAIITNVINAILSFLGMGLKNPIFQKIAIFSLFISMLHFGVDYFLNFVDFSTISNSYFYQIASYLGLISALIVYIKLLISVFFTSQIISFFRS